MRKRVYDRTKQHQEDGTLTRDIMGTIKGEEYDRMLNEWRELLERPNTPGEFTKMAEVPRMEDWLLRGYGGMTFHLSQVLTGHGCFGKYLYRIGKRNNASCDLCGEEVDDVCHTLRDCLAWDPERIRMKRALGLARDFSLGDVIEAITSSEKNWEAFAAFVEKVIRAREDEERRQERKVLTGLPSEDEDSDW